MARLSFWDHNDKGLSFYRWRAYALAIAEFERAVSAATVPLAALHINLGAAYLAEKLYREARASLERGLALAQDDQKGHWFLARVLVADGMRFEALAELERTSALDPDSPEGRSAEAEIARLRHARQSQPPKPARGGWP